MRRLDLRGKPRPFAVERPTPSWRPEHLTVLRDGGILTLDAGNLERANSLMELMQRENLGYLAVSLGFYKTLFSAPGTSTSSEIPEEEQKQMGLSDGLIRFSIGLDNDIERTYQKMRKCMETLEILPVQHA